jgi:hypothetical protein
MIAFKQTRPIISVLNRCISSFWTLPGRIPSSYKKKANGPPLECDTFVQPDQILDSSFGQSTRFTVLIFNGLFFSYGRKRLFHTETPARRWDSWDGWKQSAPEIMSIDPFRKSSRPKPGSWTTVKSEKLLVWYSCAIFASRTLYSVDKRSISRRESLKRFGRSLQRQPTKELRLTRQSSYVSITPWSYSNS